MRYFAFGAFLICTMMGSPSVTAQVVVIDIVFINGDPVVNGNKGRTVSFLEDRSAQPSEVAACTITQPVPSLGANPFVVVFTPDDQKITPVVFNGTVTLSIDPNQHGTYRFYFGDDQSIQIIQVSL